jgi:hypothetical protein
MFNIDLSSHRETGLAVDGRDLGEHWPAVWQRLREREFRRDECPRERTPPLVVNEEDAAGLSPAWNPFDRLDTDIGFPLSPSTETPAASLGPYDAPPSSQLIQS